MTWEQRAEAEADGELQGLSALQGRSALAVWLRCMSLQGKGAEEVSGEKQGTPGVVPLFPSCIASHLALLFQLVCSCSVWEVLLLCKFTELCALWYASSHRIACPSSFAGMQFSSELRRCGCFEPKPLVLQCSSACDTRVVVVSSCALLSFVISLAGCCPFYSSC